MSSKATLYILLFFITLDFLPASGQHSVAREWNEVLLEAIRNDFARPTVHARNLFHVSVAMYDAWAAYEELAKPYLLGDSVDNYYTPFTGIDLQGLSTQDRKAAKEEAISYAAYRIMKHRFQNSPGATFSLPLMDTLFSQLGYSTSFTSINYQSGSAAALGNYIAYHVINFGLQDGSNEAADYANIFYNPINPEIFPDFPGNPNIVDPNRWQPLSLDVFIDQSGNPLSTNTPEFLSPEWGAVTPFAIHDSMIQTQIVNGDTFEVTLDPGGPPRIHPTNTYGENEAYQWNFSLVSVWSAQLDPNDTTLIDISPASRGNVSNYPNDLSGYQSFYDLLNGGQPSIGHTLNPVTGQPYAPQLVKRGDYTRVLAEFWADGPDSETPPGHWFTILNYVVDHPLFQKKWMGNGPVLDDLEWDVKAYFTLGGALHDAAIAAWGIKGRYDYIRPISAIRYMAAQGQCTDTLASNFSPLGIPLIPGYIETVDTGDVLQGINFANVGKIKLMAWKGPDSISDPAVDVAGVGWILAENWWPYQRPTFVTPPFAGYISGHSTYSRAAAEVLTMMSGDPYFPGGMGQFFAPQNFFLVFEEGPSQNVVLQWATYRDAADECGLSRIWGGIHPPADDIPGRIIGEQLGINAFNYADYYFDANKLTILPDTSICDDDSISIFGSITNQAGAYYQYLQASDGNDSTIIQGLIVHPTYAINLSPTRICEMDSIFLMGAFRSNAGMYYDTLSSIYGCDVYLSQELLIDSLTEINLGTFIEDTVCINPGPMLLPSASPSGGFFEGVGIQGSFFFPSLAGLGSHTVYYYYTNNMNCTSVDSTDIDVVLCLSAEELNKNSTINIYPNPSDGHFIIQSNNVLDVSSIKIYNAAFMELPVEIIETGIDRLEIDLSDFSNGLYFMIHKHQNNTNLHKIVKINP